MGLLWTFLYVSRATQPCGRSTIRDILEISRRNNRRLDLTGCLLYSGRHFVQVLEGLDDAVLPLAERIVVDRRHHDVRVLRSAPCDERSHGDWAMGYLHELALADQVDALLAGAEADGAVVETVLTRMRTDAVMGGY